MTRPQLACKRGWEGASPLTPRSREYRMEEDLHTICMRSTSDLHMHELRSYVTWANARKGSVVWFGCGKPSALGDGMHAPDDLVQLAEQLANDEAVVAFATSTWRDPELQRRFEDRPAETLAEHGIRVPDGLNIVPVGFGQLGMPSDDFLPFQIRLTKCRTIVVKDENSGMFKTETVCFGFEIVPQPWPGPVG
jgi:hypothetical protein